MLWEHVRGKSGGLGVTVVKASQKESQRIIRNLPGILGGAVGSRKAVKGRERNPEQLNNAMLLDAGSRIVTGTDGPLVAQIAWTVCHQIYRLIQQGSEGEVSTGERSLEEGRLPQTWTASLLGAGPWQCPRQGERLPDSHVGCERGLATPLVVRCLSPCCPFSAIAAWMNRVAAGLGEGSSCSRVCRGEV